MIYAFSSFNVGMFHGDHFVNPGDHFIESGRQLGTTLFLLRRALYLSHARISIPSARTYSAAFIKRQNKMQHFAIEMHSQSQRFAIICEFIAKNPLCIAYCECNIC